MENSYYNNHNAVTLKNKQKESKRHVIATSMLFIFLKVNGPPGCKMDLDFKEIKKPDSFKLKKKHKNDQYNQTMKVIKTNLNF